MSSRAGQRFSILSCPEWVQNRVLRNLNLLMIKNLFLRNIFLVKPRISRFRFGNNLQQAYLLIPEANPFSSDHQFRPLSLSNLHKILLQIYHSFCISGSPRHQKPVMFSDSGRFQNPILSSVKNCGIHLTFCQIHFASIVITVTHMFFGHQLENDCFLIHCCESLHSLYLSRLLSPQSSIWENFTVNPNL